MLKIVGQREDHDTDILDEADIYVLWQCHGAVL
jgi:hypothetical protein